MKGNNYFFTDAQLTVGYQWSDEDDTSACIDGQVRFSIGDDEVGLSNIDSNSIDRANYFLTLSDTESYDV
jgi:hypothetical protein